MTTIGLVVGWLVPPCGTGSPEVLMISACRDWEATTVATPPAVVRCGARPAGRRPGWVFVAEKTGGCGCRGQARRPASG
ncbi:MAG TPA: hypothetical protein VF933_27755 [Streptosporangiaceae bacterium]